MTYRQLKSQNVDFQVVDNSAKYPDGYMTECLHPLHVSNEEFVKQMQDFTDHELDLNDRWPSDHEAAGLPKDGYLLLRESGRCKLAAARLVGLPTPPYQWDRVGTRHLAALSACWALRRRAAMVIVRSDS